MKQYQTQEDGSLSIDGMTIPANESNRHYSEALELVELGEAEILPYVAPVVDPAVEQIAALEASVTARNLRGAALGDQFAIDYIQSVEDKIQALRV